MALYYAQQYAVTKLSVPGGITAVATTGIILQSVTGIDTAKAGVLCLSWSDPLDDATYEYITYTSINGSKELQGVTRGAEGSTARAHDNLSDVAWIVTKSHINNLNAAMVAEHSEAGVHSAISKTAYSTFNAPEGFLINGKIVPSVASNNLTVAIKGMDGNDPSATNPVYVRIGSVVRSITSALAVISNAGSSWCNLGSAELATKETDLFVYLGWDSLASTVGMGISRIPYGTTWADFNLTASNEKACLVGGVGGWVNTTSTDQHVNIGRFAATLSAGAGYTWTVPTFTASNLIQRPIYETRWLAWNCTFGATGSMTFGSITGTTDYKIINSNIHLRFVISGTTGGTASYAITWTRPLGLSAPRRSAMQVQNGATTSLAGFIIENEIRRYDGSNWLLTGSAGPNGTAVFAID